MKESRTKKVKRKSASQRLRGILFLHWEWNQSTDEFEEFYEMEMEKIIKFAKDAYL